MDMTISTVEIRTVSSLQTNCPSARLLAIWRYGLGRVLLLLFALTSASVYAGPVPGPWTALFKGIDLSLGTNSPSIDGNFPELQVVRCVRVDLTDPDVRLFSTLRAPNPISDSRETLTLTVPHFLAQNRLQIACDANFYSANPGGSDPTSEGISCEVFGLQISQGQVISAQTTADASGDPRYSAILFTTNNQATMIFVNSPPGTNTSGIYTAVTGYYPIVSNGVDFSAAAAISYPDPVIDIHGLQPRTAFGLSKDNRYLYLMTIDGRQYGYSDGAVDSETAYWMIQFGAWNAVNMDGGGSTALYMADSTGSPQALNHSSYLPNSGHERYIGSHFGVFAKPLPGFFNDVSELSDDTAATVTWTTLETATTQVQYGPTTNFGSFSTFLPAMVTNHAALLTNLTRATPYYFQIIAKTATDQYVSSNFLFTTTNYVATTSVFDLTNIWTYTTANLDGVNWTAPGYDDSGWLGSGPGLLWVDVSGLPNASIPVPTLTQMPWDPNTGNPYPTYYLRTHFIFTNNLNGVVLLSTDYLDDGAVFYLNGAEIYRLRMSPYPAPISNATLASGYPCSGNATCPDFWSISGDLVTNLLIGDNVLAVEAHNYSAGSPDITFGLAFDYTEPFSSPPQMSISQSNATLAVSWNRGGFTLQQAGSPAGPWTNAPGPVVSSPFMTTNVGSAQYFRLSR
jgi:hypothetical protein